MSDKRKYIDRAEYLKKAVARKRKLVRSKAIRYKGEKCILCGYNRCKQTLEFHHLKDEKEFGISAKGYTRSWNKVKKELDKCILICANCHREIHDNITQPPKEILE